MLVLLTSVRRFIRPIAWVVAAFVAAGVIAPHLVAVAARNWGYIALNRMALEPTYVMGRCGVPSPYAIKADRAFAFAQTIANNDPRTLSGLATIRLCSGDIAAATLLLQSAHQSLPGDSVIGLRLAAVKLVAGDALGAVAEWNAVGAAAAEMEFLYKRRISSEDWLAPALFTAFNQTPIHASPLVWYWLGLWLEDEHRYGQAASTFGKALSDPAFDNHADRPAAARSAARDWAKTGDWQAAKTILEATVLEYPQFSDLWVSLGDIYRDDLHENEQAKRAYERAIGLPNAGGDPYVHLGDLYLGQKQVTTARCYFQLALTIQPNNPFTHVEMGRADQALGEYSQAVAEYELALSENSDLAQVPPLLDNAKKLAESTSQPGSSPSESATPSPVGPDACARLTVRTNFPKVTRG